MHSVPLSVCLTGDRATDSATTTALVILTIAGIVAAVVISVVVICLQAKASHSLRSTHNMSS